MLKGLFSYVETGAIPALAPRPEMAFHFIKERLDSDTRRWEEVRQKRIDAGRLGGIESGKSRSEAKEANASFAKQTKANEAVSGSVPVTVPVTDISAGSVPGSPRPRGKSNYWALEGELLERSKETWDVIASLALYGGVDGHSVAVIGIAALPLQANADALRGILRKTCDGLLPVTMRASKRRFYPSWR